MSNEQDQFEKLRLLLSLKRHEQPPPGFFNRLSGDIIAQIRAGQTLNTLSLDEKLELQAPWLQRLWKALEAKPIFAGSFGVAVCGLLLAGIAYHISPDPTPTNSFVPVAESFVSGSQANPLILTEFSEPVRALPQPTMLLASTGQVQSLLPTAPQRHPYAFPVNATR